MSTRQNLIAGAVTILLVTAVCAFKACQPFADPLEFKSVREVRVKLEGSPLHVVALHEDTTPVLVVSESPMTKAEAVDYLVRHVLLPNKGKAIVMQVQTDHEARHTDWRSWGSVSATGDPVLLRRLDDLLR